MQLCVKIQGSVKNIFYPRLLLLMIFATFTGSIICGLSLNEIEFRDICKIIFKELREALMVGLTLAAANIHIFILTFTSPFGNSS